MQVLGRMELERVLRLRAVSAIVPCRAVDDDIIVDGRRIVLGRQNRPGREGFCRSLADFASPEGYVGLFALSAGLGAEDMIAGYEAEGDDYRAMITRLLCDRLAEALAEWLHYEVRTHQWGYAPTNLSTPRRFYAAVTAAYVRHSATPRVRTIRQNRYCSTCSMRNASQA